MAWGYVYILYVIHLQWIRQYTYIHMTMYYCSTYVCACGFLFPLQTVYLVPPGVSEYAGERCLLNCYPVLYGHGISDLSKAPCLSALLKNLHHILIDQYTYEEVCKCTSHFKVIYTHVFTLPPPPPPPPFISLSLSSFILLSPCLSLPPFLACSLILSVTPSLISPSLPPSLTCSLPSLSPSLPPSLSLLSLSA